MIPDTEEVVETLARAICGKNCDMPKCSCQPDDASRKACRRMSMDAAERAIAAVPTIATRYDRS